MPQYRRWPGRPHRIYARPRPKLLLWCTLYGTGLALFALSLHLGRSLQQNGIPMIAYLVVGFVLNRMVFRAINNGRYPRPLGRAAIRRLLAFLLWPLAYGFVLTELLIVEVL